MNERKLFETQCAASLHQVWQDDYGGVWLQANDTDKVVVPAKFVARVKDLFVKYAKVAASQPRDASAREEQ